MTRQLPSKPSLEHLRNQAKDVHKAHKRGDPSCCAVLRHLPQLKDKPDADILAAEVGLQEVQFAIAREYGTRNWDDLKTRVVLQHAAANPAANVTREDARVMINNIPGPQGKSTVISALTRCLMAMGKEVDYASLMGVGGQAFRIQFNWCPSAPHCFCGHNTSNPALAAVGYGLVQLSTNRPSHRPDLDPPPEAQVANALAAAKASVDSGTPALMDWEESDVLGGYETAEGTIRLLLPNGQPVKSLPWSVGLLLASKPERAYDEAVLASLRFAVDHAHGPISSGMSSDEQQVMSYPGGFAAWQKWIDELQPAATPAPPAPATAGDATVKAIDALPDDRWFGYCLGNAWTLECLLDARYTADKYLQKVSPILPAAMRGHLAEAAGQYRRVGEAVELAWHSARYPWKPNARAEWNGEARRSQAEALAKAFEYEKQAVLHLERALAEKD